MTTFVLLPGAGGTSWYWHLVAAELEARGHRAISVELPGDDPSKGLPEYAAIAAGAVTGERVTVVAQSMGGFTAPLVAPRLSGDQSVERLVFVNAMIPNPGERPGEWWGNVGSAQAQYEAAVRGHYSTEFDLDIYFLHDVSPELAAEGEPYQRPEAERAFGDPCDFESWPDIPISVVAGADDRFFPLELQRRVALDRLGRDVVVLPGGHLMALSHPIELVDYLLG